MVDLSSAVQWWEEWQLRILVLGSMFLQWFLFLSASLRKLAISSLFRFFIWLAYLGSDALAIYALATLFNRHKDQDGSFPHRGTILEVLWAPILLGHLGGLSVITAYNMEDNETWRRHVVTTMSQFTVANYVFCKSWPADGDRQLLLVAILWFLCGLWACSTKNLTLMLGSGFGLLRSVSRATGVSTRRGETRSDPVEHFVQEAKAFTNADQPPTASDASIAARRENGRLILDLLSPYSDRLHLMKCFWVLEDHQKYDMLKRGLSSSFDLLYTKNKVTHTIAGYLVLVISMLMQLTAIVLFIKSHKEAYNQVDVKVTYTLLCSWLVLLVCTPFAHLLHYGVPRWPEQVAQYSLIGYLIKGHSKWIALLRVMSLAFTSLLLVQHDYILSLLQPLYSKKSCGSSSSRSIVKLVLGHLKSGWKEHIRSAATYRMFNDQRGQLTLRRNNCDQDLGWSLMGPFDESVLLWHVATDFCFYYPNGASPDHQCGTEQIILDASGHGQCHGSAWCENSPHHEKAVQCREISNYMMHLLYLNPEMLMVGARQYLFTVAYEEIKEMFKGERTDQLEDKGLTQRIITKVQSQEGSQEGFIKDAWALAQKLLSLGDEKMWEVIQGVWVEKLCFSAGRSRGYLHAKSLATGGELLNYVWLLMSYMGMETLAEKLQRAELPSEGGNTNVAPSTSKVPTGGGATSTSEAPTDATPPTSDVPTGAAPSTSEAPTTTTISTSKVPSGAAPSTSEISIAVE